MTLPGAMKARRGPRAPRRLSTTRGILLAMVLAAVLPGLVLAADVAGQWGWLGVRIRDLSEQEMDEISQRHGIREGFGAMVVEVIEDTPAADAGMRAGDLVVAFRDRPTVDTRTLQRMVAGARVGDTVSITVLRRELGRRQLSVRLGPMPGPVVAERVAAEFGFLVRDPDAARELGGPRPTARPAVAVVLRGGAAEKAGLKAGDVLLEIDGHPVLTLEAVRQALAAVSIDAPLPLTVIRGDDQMSVVITRPRRP